MTTTKNWDNLNRLSAISSQSSAGGTSYSYTYNDANQRTRATLADDSYWDYGYDSLGQVTSGHKKWSDNSSVAGQQYDYTFDSIGNRTADNANGRESAYTANDLNQYTERTVPGYLDILGTAESAATVTVNNQATSRHGEYFHRQLAISNATTAVFTNIWIVGVRKNSGGDANQPDTVTTETGHEFVPKTPEVFGYDSDGNLTNDGRWAYTWDAENRITEMQTLGNLPSSVPRQKLVFEYDYRGRRVQKIVLGWSGPPLSMWLIRSLKRFIYDDWNLTAEREVFPTPATQRTFTWGLDLSGSQQGAGGIGGLLLVSNHGSPVTNSFAAYDGNGNVTALVDAGTGSNTAEYAYGPFGEIIRATGSAAEANPFRFSTKHTDEETGLLYYGYRYYNPSTGRWPSTDPIGEKGGRNLYALVGNDAVSRTDAHGLRITITKLGDDPLNFSVVATIQVRKDCSCAVFNTPNIDAIKSEIQTIWRGKTTYDTYAPGATPGDWITVPKPIQMTTSVDIKYVPISFAPDSDRHTFLLSCKQSTRDNRSHVDQIGGIIAEIYVGDHLDLWAYAHEFGHWLGLANLYDEETMQPRRPEYAGNVMATWHDRRVDGWQMESIVTMRPRSYNIGLP